MKNCARMKTKKRHGNSHKTEKHTIASKNGDGSPSLAKKNLPDAGKSLESWIWDAACSIRGAKDAAKYKEFILPLIFTKRLCDVFDDELNHIAKELGSRAKAFKLVKHDKKLLRFYLPLEPKNPEDTVWSVIRTLSDKNRPAVILDAVLSASAVGLAAGEKDPSGFNRAQQEKRYDYYRERQQQQDV
jgi:hypothetical protein